MAVPRKRPVNERAVRASLVTGRKGKQIGPNIVRAWFDTVINPLLRSLETERELLQKGNWTWRFRPAGLELIRPARAYLEPEAQENLGQFVVLNPDAKGRIDLHDSKILPLLEECIKLHRAIKRDGGFRELYSRVTSPESLSELKVMDMSAVFGAYPKQDQLELLAQYVTNKVGELGLYYTGAILWNRYRGDFLKVRGRSDVRGYCQSAAREGALLLREVNRLIALLEEKRLELSLEHDQPYVAATRPAGVLERSF